jgi:hypothetical protein
VLLLICCCNVCRMIFNDMRIKRHAKRLARCEKKKRKKEKKDSRRDETVLLNNRANSYRRGLARSDVDVDAAVDVDVAAGDLAARNLLFVLVANNVEEDAAVTARGPLTGFNGVVRLLLTGTCAGAAACACALLVVLLLVCVCVFCICCCFCALGFGLSIICMSSSSCSCVVCVS